MSEQCVTFEQVIAFAQAAMDGADALDQPLAGNHIAAGLELLRVARENAERARSSASC
ncbi:MULTISPECIES: hypothetical protein [Sphingomonas]|jgi:hypothetical protein|uniref:Uncharacterized protein n=1 Tax=Sphingomonas zeae TaxID=1646122 RepID=A0A7Y6B4N8_9SPHN|nr:MULTISPECIES: hypothetical protein [Sphingomonas]MBB4048161.1 hypothetical protein [Sphingomonas zeae]MDK8184760.1 hypothetical protein [Sphingomonas zeae]MDK8215481.1 hypothetical protein [Sphingomonas sp. UMB7805-LC452B]NUU46935.1 hypothetical protein [Sphingomonas zeae]